MNKKQSAELAQLQTKWNMDCTQAVENPVAYILKRSREDYVKVMGSENGLPGYQADILSDSGVGTHEEVAVTERIKLAEQVMDRFSNVPGNTVMGLIGHDLVHDLLNPTQAPVEIDFSEVEQEYGKPSLWSIKLLPVSGVDED